MAILTFSAQLDANVPIVEEFPDGLKASAYFEDYLFKLFQDIENINTAAGLAYGIINGDSGQATADQPTDEINIIGGTSISTAAAEGSPDSLVITNDDPFPEAPIDGQPYGRRDAGWVDLDTLFIGDAPSDGQTYARNNGAWVDITAGLNQDHGLLTGLGDDDHTQYLLLAGRAGGQTAIGGTASGESLVLRGSAHSGFGEVEVVGPMFFSTDFTTFSPANQNIITYDAVVPSSGGAVAAFILVNPDITITSGVFIPSTVRDIGTYNQAVNPGFAVHTVFLGQPNLETTTATVQPNQSFMFASQAIYENDGAGNVTTHVANIIGLTHSPQLAARQAADRLNVTNMTGLQVQPSYSTVAGSFVDFGTIRWVSGVQPVQGLFQPGAGTETIDAAYGLDFPNWTFGGGSNVVSVLRSSLAAGTNRRFLDNLSTAASDFGASVVHWDDNGVIQLGGAVNAADVSLFWDGTQLRMFFWSTSDSLQYTSPAADTFLIESNAPTQNELRLNFRQFAFGQSGDVGNQVGVFVANARTAGVAGGWADFLLTQAGNLNLGVFAMSDVSGWVINPISFDNTAYSIAELATLRVGGMTTSNPGGTVTERAGLWTRGRTMQQGTIQFDPITPAALAAGDNDDWAGLLTGSPNNNGREWGRVTGNATTSTITGIDATAVQDGDQYTLTNVGTETILISHQDTGSSAANRIITPDAQNFVLSEGRSASLRYDSTDSRWRIITAPAAVAPLTGTWQFDSNTTMADPGSGNFRNNNGTIGSVTAIAINDITETGVDAGNILAAIASGDQLYIQNREDGDEFLVFDVTSNTDNTGWHQIGGTVNASGSNFTDGKEFNITVIFA